jgi:acyl carrier protein
MTRSEIYEELTEIFRDIFDDDELVIGDETTADDIEDWDSLEQINLLVAIEKKFNIKIRLGDVSGLENVGRMVDLIERLI